MKTLPANIEKRIQRTDTCWLWTGPPTAGGYGQVRYGGTKHLIHRLVYTLLTGDSPQHLHHECRVKMCVNPAHLSGLTGVEHAAIHAAEHIKDVCVNGHDMADAYIVRRGLRSGGPIKETRTCSQCVKDRNSRDWREYPAEKRAALVRDRSERRRRSKASR